jgi:peptidylprolyl isomerase
MILFQATSEDDPILQTASIDGLLSLVRRQASDHKLADSVFDALVGLLETDDSAVRAVAADGLGDSLLLRPAAVSPLLQALSMCRSPYDTEAMQGIIATLGKLRDSRAVQPLMKQLESPDASVATAAAEALQMISGADFRSRIPRRSAPLTTDLDFDFLRALPSVVHVRLETSRGNVLIDLQPDLAPFTVMSIVKLSQQRGFYRGLLFHRVVPNFVVQGGDPRGDGWGGPGYELRSEFSMTGFTTGTVGMASAGKDTEGSQFFIALSPQPHLDGRYTVVGSVIDGMDVVNALQVEDRIYDIVTQ